MRKTKIICTLGPSTDKNGVLEELIKEGDAIYIKGHEAHASLIQQEARGESVAVNMLLMHAEDQLMAAENFKAFAQQQIVIFKKFQDIENR